MVLGKPLAALRCLGCKISTLPNLTDNSARRAARPGAGSSTVIVLTSSQTSALENREVPVGQTAILRRPHQHFHVGGPEREAFINVAFAIFHHSDAGCGGFGQGAGAFRAPQPVAATLLLKRPLPAFLPFAALTRQKEKIRARRGAATLGRSETAPRLICRASLSGHPRKTRFCSSECGRRELARDIVFNRGGGVEQKQSQKQPEPGDQETDVVPSADQDGGGRGAPARRLRSSRPSDLAWPMIGSTAALRRNSRLTVGDRWPGLCVTWISGATSPSPGSPCRRRREPPSRR